MGSYVRKQSYVLDTLLQLKDAGALTANTDPTQVAGADAIINVGEGRMAGTLLLDSTVAKVSAGDEKYTLTPVYSSSATFASDIVEGPAMILGDATVLGGDIDLAVGRFEIPISNVFNGLAYKYMKLKLTVAGTSPSINFIAHVAKQNSN